MSKRSDAGRAARTAALIDAQRRKERNRNLIVAGVVVVVVAVVLGLTLLLGQQDETGETAGDGGTPSGLTDGYSVVVGEESAPTTIAIYEDPQCPICAAFEQEVGDRLAAAVEDGRVKVEYRLVSFLDPQSGNEYSSRAANAAMAVLDTAGVEAFVTFHETIFANQPAEGTDGPEDDRLVEWAVEAGADEAEVTPQIEDKVYEQWLKNATDQMSKAGINGTPGVVIDGERVDGNPVTSLLEAID